MEIKTEKMTLEEAKQLGIDNWMSWSCEPSVFDWHYSDKETAYVFKGLVKVTPDGGEPVEITGGMLVTFPAGMACTWEVVETIEKVYTFG